MTHRSLFEIQKIKILILRIAIIRKIQIASHQSSYIYIYIYIYTRSLRSLVSYRVKHSKRNSISTHAHVLFSLSLCLSLYISLYIDACISNCPLIRGCREWVNLPFINKPQIIRTLFSREVMNIDYFGITKKKIIQSVFLEVNG